MRTLLYVPVIHTSADLGSLAKEVARKGIKDLGEEMWRKHEDVVINFWKALMKYFDSMEVTGVNIYQDGMVANNEIGQKIVEEGVKSGSKNYELISRLLQKGGVLVKTEDLDLLREERNYLLKITQSATEIEKLLWLLRYKLKRNSLLNRRDDFISGRIDETLKDGGKGVIFIGAYHNIKQRLPEDINLIEIKEVEKVREYHKLLPFYYRNKQRLEDLGIYLVSDVTPSP